MNCQPYYLNHFLFPYYLIVIITLSIQHFLLELFLIRRHSGFFHIPYLFQMIPEGEIPIWEDAGFLSLSSNQFLLEDPPLILRLCSSDYLHLLYLSSDAGPKFLAVNPCSPFWGEGVESLLWEAASCGHTFSVTESNGKAQGRLSRHC